MIMSGEVLGMICNLMFAGTFMDFYNARIRNMMKLLSVIEMPLNGIRIIFKFLETYRCFKFK